MALVAAEGRPVHRELGLSDRAIAKRLGVSDKTVAKAIRSPLVPRTLEDLSYLLTSPEGL